MKGKTKESGMWAFGLYVRGPFSGVTKASEKCPNLGMASQAVPRRPMDVVELEHQRGGKAPPGLPGRQVVLEPHGVIRQVHPR